MDTWIGLSLLVISLVGPFAGAVIVLRQDKPAPTKPRVKTRVTCPKPKLSQEYLLVKIRDVKSYTSNGNHEKALVVLEELDCVLSSIITNTNNSTNVIPVNSGELKE